MSIWVMCDRFQMFKMCPEHYDQQVTSLFCISSQTLRHPCYILSEILRSITHWRQEAAKPPNPHGGIISILPTTTPSLLKSENNSSAPDTSYNPRRRRPNASLAPLAHPSSQRRKLIPKNTLSSSNPPTAYTKSSLPIPFLPTPPSFLPHYRSIPPPQPGEKLSEEM